MLLFYFALNIRGKFKSDSLFESVSKQAANMGSETSELELEVTQTSGTKGKTKWT